MSRLLTLFEALLMAALLAGAGYLASRETPQWMTVTMLVIVGGVWGYYRFQLSRWVRSNRWVYAPRIEGDAVADPLRPLVGGVEASLVEFRGQRYRTASCAEVLGSDGLGVGSLRPPALLGTGQAVLVSLGLAGTFLGLTIGLWNAPDLIGRQVAPDPSSVSAGADEEADLGRMKSVMGELLGGAQLAFTKSLAGVVLAMAWGLRLRHVESRRDQALDALADELDRRWPLLTTQHIQAEAANEAARTNALLVELAVVFRSESERSAGLAAALTEEVGQVRASVEQRSEDLVVTMQGLAESLPSAIGEQTGQNLLPLLAPQFQLLVEEMKKITEAGGRQISDAMLGKADAEVSSLKRALSEVVSILDRLPAEYRAQMGKVEDGVHGAMLAVGAGVSAAASELATASGELRGVVGEIGRVLPEVVTAATALRGAGEDVRSGLDGVAAPLLGLPPVLDSTRTALLGASSAFNASQEAMARQIDASQALSEAVGAHHRAAEGATLRAEALTSQLEQLRSALSATEDRLQSLTADHAAASGDSVAQLARTLQEFQDSLEAAQRSIAAGTKGAVEQAEGLTVEAARRVAEALARGASEFEGSMKRLADHGATMETSFAAARTTADALLGHATALRDGMIEVARPLGPITSALGAVPASVQSAAQALRTEHTALQGLAGELRQQAVVLRAEEQALTVRIAEYQQLNSILGTQMAAHLQGLLKANDQVRASWAEVNGKSREVVQQTATTLSTYASQVERALHLPGDLRRLDQSIVELADVLADLKTALADRAREAGGVGA